MSSAAECPSTDVLNRLLAGSLSNGEADRVSRHVDGCLACQHLLDGSDNLSIVVERMVPGVVGDYGPAFYRALDALLAAQSASATEAFHPFFARLLEPSNDHRYLGRLGHYDVISPLGHGGMGIVLRAHDAVLNREVALKILAPHLSHQPNARERFAREARAAAAINHDNVLSIHAVSEAAGLPYLVMPYVVGRSLAERIEREGRLPLAEVLTIALQAALGLAAAHERGVVHRDIKPSNLLLEGDSGRVKIADFGLATVLDGLQLTQSGTLAGTPEFMSPEQAREEPVDGRCDLFSLGAVIYLMITGESPFRAASPLATLRRVCDDTPPLITQFNPDATAWLAAVVERLLQKHPEDRYQTAAELAESLRYQLATVGQQRRPAPRINPPATTIASLAAAPLTLDSAPASVFDVASLARVSRVSKARRAVRQHRVPIVVLTACICALLVWMLWQQSHRANVSVAQKKQQQRTTSQKPQNQPSATRTKNDNANRRLSTAHPRKQGLSPSPMENGLTNSTTAAAPHTPRLAPDASLAITSIQPTTGPMGTPVTIRGRGFSTTKRVLFYVRNGSKDAAFRIVDDDALLVVAPEWLKDDASATIVVETPEGIAVSFPESFTWENAPSPNTDSYSERPGYFVVRDGRTRHGPAGTVLVQSGGTLNSFGSYGDIKVVGPFFVQREGTVDISSRQAVVYVEPDAILSQSTLRNTRVINTPKISVNDAGCFTYTACAGPTYRKTTGEPPHVVGIRPYSALPGEVITVSGSGFLNTEMVELISAHGVRLRPQPGFRIVDDSTLRVEIPDDRTKLNYLRGGGGMGVESCHLLIVTPLGATVTATQDEFHVIDDASSETVRDGIAWVSKGGVYSGHAGLVFVESGGAVLEVGNVFDDARAIRWSLGRQAIFSRIGPCRAQRAPSLAVRRSLGGKSVDRNACAASHDELCRRRIQDGQRTRAVSFHIAAAQSTLISES